MFSKKKKTKQQRTLSSGGKKKERTPSNHRTPGNVGDVTNHPSS